MGFFIRPRPGEIYLVGEVMRGGGFLFWGPVSEAIVSWFGPRPGELLLVGEVMRGWIWMRLFHG